jgi:hypothetical protein
MRLKPKRHIVMRLRTDRPAARSFLADEAARRCRQEPMRVDSGLAAALIGPFIGNGGAGEGGTLQ